MPYFCAVKGCGNTVLTTKGKSAIVYHAFPKNGERLHRWITFCGQSEHWKPQKNQGICSHHFHESKYDGRYQMRHELYGAKQRRVLLPNAVPTMHPPALSTKGTSLHLDNSTSMNPNTAVQQSSLRDVYNNTNESNVSEPIDDTVHGIAVEHNYILNTTEECYEEEMLIEKLEDSDDPIGTELKIEPRSPLNATDDQPDLDDNVSHSLDINDIKIECNEELVEIPLPQVEIIANPLDIPTENQLINQFCRLCLREIPNLFPLMSRIQNLLVPEMFHSVTGININFRDKLPKKVCINCLIRLDYAYNIRKEFLEAHRTLKGFSMTKILPLLDHLHNYQKGIRLTTESYGEQILRQHKDIIRMRLIKKQEHLEELAESEALEELTRNMPVEMFMGAFTESFPKYKADTQRRHEEVDLRVDVDSETIINQTEEYVEEETIEDKTTEANTSLHIVSNKSATEERKIEDKTVEAVTVKQNISLQSVSNKTSTEERNTNEPQQQEKKKSRKGSRYNMELTETEPDPNKCYICEEVFEDKSKLHVHLSTHVDMVPYSCDRCVEEGGEAKKFTSLILLHRHFRMHAGSIKCPNCPVRTFKSLELYKHMARYHRADSVGNYTCEICGHRMVYKKRFQLHMRFHQAIDEGRYQCNYCDKKLATKTRLTRHERSHTQERPYKCNYCDKVFVCETTQHVHERTHTGEKGFRCDICDKGFRVKNALLDHIGETHDDLNESNEANKKGTSHSTSTYFPEEMKCKFEGCDFSTKNRAKHYSHKAKHTLKYHCSHCSERFPTKQRLQLHEYIHTGSKQHCCDQCGKSFRYRRTFVEHMNAHQNIRPHSCKVCGMTFVRERSLQEHRLKHSEALNFECRICGKKFKYRSDYSKHRRTHMEADTDRIAFQYDNQGDEDLIVEDVADE